MDKENIDNAIEVLKKVVEKIKEYNIGEYGLSMLELSKPQYSYLIESLKQMGSMADQAKLNCIIMGLSENKNVETRMNELYSYVKKSKENAFLISDSFRKMMLSSSTIACCIMGIMLGDFAKEDRKPTQCEMIIMRALGLFTDCDMVNFVEIMGMSCNVEEDGETRYINRAQILNEKREELEMTLDFCSQNRIFKLQALVSGETLIMDAYVIDQVSERLLSYIRQAKRYMACEII